MKHHRLAPYRESSTESKARQICLITLLLVSLSAPRTARASSGKAFLETIGISTAVGTVLGASTLPFYDQPGTHLMNMVYGASAGAVAGVGLGLYQWLSGGSNRDQEIFGDYKYPREDHNLAPPISVHASTASFSPAVRDVHGRTPVLFWTPVASLTW